MDNKPVLVTGCSSGIGKHCALRLQQKGYPVIATARKLDDVATLKDQGLDAIQLDLANSDSIRHAVEQVLDKTSGRIYGLFNNAAYGQPGAVEDLSRCALRDQFETNLFGTQELTNLIIPTMRQQGEGRIIQNSSVLGFIALKFRGAYNASKFALEGLSDTLRMELDGSGVYVSLIEPGPVLSDFRKNALVALENNIDIENSVHAKTYQSVLAKLKKEGAVVPFTLGPESVFTRLLHALQSPKPKLRYYVTKPTYAFAYLKRILPQRLMDRLLIYASGEENRQ